MRNCEATHSKDCDPVASSVRQARLDQQIADKQTHYTQYECRVNMKYIHAGSEAVALIATRTQCRVVASGRDEASM